MSALSKLMEARIILQGKTLKKSGLNKFAGYQYFELGDFLPTVQTIFADLKLGGFVSYGLELATLTIVDLEQDHGTCVIITSPMAEANLKGCHPIQNLGAAQTYLRRYLWVTALELVEHDAVDSSEPVKEVAAAKQPALTYEETKPHFNKWEGIKADLAAAQADGVADGEALASAWGKIPSHIRTAIKKYAKEIQEEMNNIELDKRHLETTQGE